MSRVGAVLSALPVFSTTQYPLLFDVGSTTTRLMHKGKIVHQEPTCIAVHARTRDVVAIGSKAVSLLGKVSDKFEVIFPMVGGEFVSDKMASLFLEALLQKVAVESLTKLVGFSVVVVVPTVLSPVQQQVYQDVFAAAGFRSCRLVAESDVLLDGVGGKGKKETFCYFDLGGQKSEAVIFTLDEVIQTHDFAMGGVLFTEAVQRQVRLQHNIEISWQIAETIKQEICTLAPFITGGSRVKPIKMTIRGKDVVTQAGKTVIISSEDFTDTFSFFVEELLDELQYFFSTVPAHLVAETLESGVFITGGLSAMAGMRELLETTFSTPVRMSTQSQLDVCKSLALYIGQHETER